MHITLTKDYSVRADTSLLGYQGETNSRKITFSGLVVESCDLYKLQILYSDGKVYELPIQNEEVTITGSILREIGYVSCQLLGYSVAGEEYTIVFKSNIFELEIKEAIEGDVAPIPPYEESAGALEKILAGVEAANGYAKSAETAADRAETARAEAVKSQNDAKVSAAQASTAAQQAEADKIITAGYAKTAKANADSTSADRQAVQTLAEQVATDKANVAENAAKVANDRIAAETAAQKAQSVADSLPEDYVTAVAKIAENTEEIASLKVSDKELQRRVNALYALGQGITHQFETDSSTAYVKTIPTGGRLMSVKSIGGKNLVFNQLANVTDLVDETFDLYYNEVLFGENRPKWTKGHKYLFEFYVKSSIEPFTVSIGYSNKENVAYTLDGESFSNVVTSRKLLLFTPDDSLIDSGYQYIGLRPVRYDTQKHCTISVRDLMIFDLTLMFGAGNEPATVEEFKTLFSDDYYPYNAGEIITADTESVVVRGQNLWDEIWEEGSIDSATGVDISAPTVIRSKNYTPIIPNSTYIFAYAGSTAFENVKTRFYDIGKKYIGYNDNNAQTVYPNRAFVTPVNAAYVRFTLPPTYGNVYKNDIALLAGSSGAYTPYHQIGYPIPEAIRALTGYGWSAGTAKNYIDCENKQYHQCISSVDLGTLDWTIGEKISFQTKQIKGLKLTHNYNVVPNVICAKYQSKTQNDLWGKDVTGISADANADGYVYVNDTSYTDATTFKQAMSGVTLYYELANPVVTDISSLIPDDFLRNIEVEPLGSITFKNSNDNYHIPVPSEEEYVVKLNEVGGTT